MNDDSLLLIEETKENMNNTIQFFDRELQKTRAGKSSPQMLDGVRVDYYDNPTPLSQVANISTPDASQIIVQPWEKTMLAPIEKAIMAANLGFNPQNNGEFIRIIVPQLTEERRKELVKKVKADAEQAKVNIRNVRRNSNDQAKKLEKDGLPEDEAKRLETEIQKMTDDFVSKIDKMTEAKEKDIMTV
ncbi:MAG: ribosome recycling factor [Bacteroidales bacterium]|jgi:ribosome recycling factor|nr:ribosome recycling factor [Bacteroidales bacterium]